MFHLQVEQGQRVASRAILLKTIPKPAFLREHWRRRGGHQGDAISRKFSGTHREEHPLPVVFQKLTGFFGGLEAGGVNTGLLVDDPDSDLLLGEV